MDPVHREVLDSNHSKLVTALRAGDVIEQLLRDDALNKYDYDQIKRTEAQGSRAVNRLLLLTLRRRGPDAYPSLHRALRDSGQTDLCDVMLDSELNLREGLATERMARSLESYSLHAGLHGLTAFDAAETADSVPYDAADSFETSQVLNKASTPSTRRTSPSPRARPHPQEPASPASPRGREASGSKEKIQRLEEQVSELRQSHTKMEAELRQQIEDLEKEKDQQAKAGKKEGGCSVM